MKTQWSVWLILWIVSGSLGFAAPAANGLDGNWLGTLDAGTVKLRIVFHIRPTTGDGYTATMDSLDQGASGLAVERVSLQDHKVRIEVKVVQGAYEGTLDPAGDRISGTWQQGMAKLPLILARTPAANLPRAVGPSTLAGAEKLAKEFISLMAAGDFPKARARLDATMKAALPGDKLAELWNGLVASNGKFQRPGSVRSERLPGYRVAFVACHFAQGALTLKVVLDSADKVAGLFILPAGSAEFRIPTYARTNLFNEVEVRVGAKGWELPGTLSLPTGPGPFPAVILVHGSGPQDRDETIHANKPFRDLAWGLASQGIAALRYEKRTKQSGPRLAASIPQFTVNEETVADAVAAAAQLRAMKGIDPRRVFVLGHSLGGTVAPRIGSRDPAIAGLIVLAGAARPLEDLMVEQTRYQASLGGKPSAETATKVAEIERAVAAVKGLSASNSPAGSFLGAPAAYWLDLRGYQPTELGRQLKQPMLVLQGENDCQVSATRDFELWRQALRSRKNVKLKSYPGLNHLFIEAAGQSTGAEYEVPGNVADAVIDDIAAWVKATGTRPAGAAAP